MESMISIKMNAATGGGGGATVINEKIVEYSNYGRHEEKEQEEEYCTGEALKEGEKMESAKAEMTEVREENVRLKMLLDKIEKDYKSLQMRFTGVFHSQTTVKTLDDEEEEPDQLVSLSLGRTGGSREVPKKENSSSSGITISKGKEEEEEEEDDHLKEGLKLGLNYNYCRPAPKPEATEEEHASPDENSSVEANNKEETWPPSKVKVTKTIRPSGDDDDHHHLSQPSVKRARVSVRARCDTPTMHDGCQWRKYGQKIAKGNPRPRAYYRCTVAPTCPVRKQVQRCADDMSILITTYEGNHNHPLPISATAMASTTSAAASMLLSGSSNSQSGLGSSNLATTTTSTSFHGLNVSNTRSLYLPNSSSSSSSSSPPFPTITLDLTTTTPTTHLNMFSSSFNSMPRFPTTSLSFSTSQPNFIPTVWGNGNLNNYGNNILPSSYNKISSARPLSQELNLQNKYQTFPQQALTETLTKAITSDPSFRTVIAAALSTVVGGAGSSSDPRAQANNNKTESLGKHMKIFPSNPLTSNGKGV